MNMKGLLAGLLSLAGAVLLAPAQAEAQSGGEATPWPDRAVRIVVPYAPGGTNDVLARLYGQKLSERLGQPFVVENRAGAQGIVGTEAVAHSKPDGYTLLLGASGPIVFNPVTYQSLPYDPVRDLVPVCQMVQISLALVTGRDSRHKDLAGFLAHARTQPGATSYGTSSAAFQLPMELLSQKAGVRSTFVAYRSSIESINAAAAGEVDVGLVDSGSMSASLAAGRIRPLAVLAEVRDPAYPDVPGVAELGFPGIDARSFSAFFAPAGTPQPILARLGEACDSVSALPEIRERMKTLGMTMVTAKPEALARDIIEGIAFWRGVAQSAGIRLER
jgi:tripartite-type tricarboxylate transporter receptor subunit TctC